MKHLKRIIEQARSDPRHIVLAEGEDARVFEGACRAAREGLARITLVGNAATIEQRLAKEGIGQAPVVVTDPQISPLTPTYAEAYRMARQAKGIDEAAAWKTVSAPLGFAAMMVRQGDADGTVGGAVATSAETVRTALQIIGRAPGARLVSSFFLMMLCEPHHDRKGAFLFADCGLVVEPDAEELADIAVASARSYRALTGELPKVAMLSFSTMGSAVHQRVDKVAGAARLARKMDAELLIDGEIQFDAAFVESICAAKLPGSTIQGAANVLVFPNLEAANIGYKIAQRIGGAEAIGPLLQGLARPANDLSRGCSVEDVFHSIAVTCVQAQVRSQQCAGAVVGRAGELVATS